MLVEGFCAAITAVTANRLMWFAIIAGGRTFSWPGLGPSRWSRLSKIRFLMRGFLGWIAIPPHERVHLKESSVIFAMANTIY